MRPDEWPHQFTKDSPEKVEDLYDSDGVHFQKKYVWMRCLHCGIRFELGNQPQPQGSCPKRNDKAERARVLQK